MHLLKGRFFNFTVMRAIISFMSIIIMVSTTISSLCQEVSFSKKTLNKIIRKSIKRNKWSPKEGWSFCGTDSAIFTSDSVRMFNNASSAYEYNCCIMTSWVFLSRSHFQKYETDLCREPPVSTLNLKNCDYQVKFKKVKHALHIIFYNSSKKVHDFTVVKIEYKPINEYDESALITLVNATN